MMPLSEKTFGKHSKVTLAEVSTCVIITTIMRLAFKNRNPREFPLDPKAPKTIFFNCGKAAA